MPSKVAVIGGYKWGSMKIETTGKDTNIFKRAEAAMHILIWIFLVLDFALACFIGVKIFQV